MFEEHCQLIWSIEAHYTSSSIDMYNDNASGAFSQLLFLQSIAKANVSIFQGLMFITKALHFGRSFGPAGWGPASNIQSFLVLWMYIHCMYQINLNDEALNLI